MLKLISTVMLASALLGSTMSAQAQCETDIKAFYTAYMQNAERNENLNAALLKAHMSPELIAKLKDYTLQYDADAVIHAQDVCDYAIRSLTVVPMKEDWYMVKYRWDDQSDYTNIPVKATKTDGQFTILDISPIGTYTDSESQAN